MILKAFSIFLSFQVLLSSMSFNLGMHFCGESLRSFSLLGAATPCEHSSSLSTKGEDKTAPCPFHAQQQKSNEDDCCNDKEVKIEGQDIDTTVNTFISDLTPRLDFLAAYVVSHIKLFQPETAASRYLNYKPPLIQIDIPVLIQTFLI